MGPSGGGDRTLFNPFFAVSDNIGSCFLARDLCAIEAVLLNGDTLFEPAVLRRAFRAPEAPITVTIDRKAAYDADDMKVSVDGTRLRAIGKTLRPDETDGKSIGLLLFRGRGGRVRGRGGGRVAPAGRVAALVPVGDRRAGAGGGVRVPPSRAWRGGRSTIRRHRPGRGVVRGWDEGTDKGGDVGGGAARRGPGEPLMPPDPDPTEAGLPRRLGDFATLAEALDYAAEGETGLNFHNGKGEISVALLYRACATDALALARRLLRAGLVRGDRVAIVAETHPTWSPRSAPASTPA